MEKVYTLRMIKREDEPIAFKGKTLYNMKQKYSAFGSHTSNTTDISKAVKFKSIDEAKKHMEFWFQKGYYEIVEL